MTTVNTYTEGGIDIVGARPDVDPADAVPIRGWRELLLCYAFYFAYSRARGVGHASAGEARRNAWQLVEWERDLGIYHEGSFQRLVMSSDDLVTLLNFFYGTAHFLVTPILAIWLVYRSPATYRKWRNVLAWTTGLALVGYLAYPLAPPRLMWGLGFTDTMVTHTSPWGLTLMPVWNVGNPYAAMPSLHMAWALWVAFVVLAHTDRPVWRALARAYPVVTLIAIVGTGNHFVLDAVGGAAVFWIGYRVVPWCAALFGVPGRRTVPEALGADPLSQELITAASVRSQSGSQWGMEGITRVG